PIASAPIAQAPIAVAASASGAAAVGPSTAGPRASPARTSNPRAPDSQARSLRLLIKPWPIILAPFVDTGRKSRPGTFNLAAVEAAVKPAATGTIVSCKDLSRRYGEGEAAVDALRGVDLDFPAGEL